jgi:Bacterial archaeo-eukaryotic release factor family 2
MTMSGDVPASALERIMRAGRHGSPVVSVALSLERAIEQAAQRNETAWRDHRRAMADAGAPEPALIALDALVPDAHHDGDTLVAFADGEGLVHASVHDGSIASDVATVGALPFAVPFVSLLQGEIPHVRARIDRSGAEIEARFAGRERSFGVHHDEQSPELRRTAPGGWSQRRHQQRAENLWAEHGKEFAAALTRAVDVTSARFVALAGDVRAVQLTCDALPERIRSLVREVPGSRHRDGSDREFDSAVAALVEATENGDTADALELLTQEVNADARAAVGAPSVFAALELGQVDRLLVAPAFDDDRRAWFAGDRIGLEASTLEDLGFEIPVPARMADVAVHGAVLSGASVRVVPEASLPDGFGALLRFA